MNAPTTAAQAATLVTGTSGLLGAALDAAERGWPVFPLAPHSKRPAIADWQQRATCDPDRIRRWWLRHPLCNLLTGLRSDTPKWTLRLVPSACRTSATSRLGGCVGVLSGADSRDIGSIIVPRWGRVTAVKGVVPWLVVDPADIPVEPIRKFLSDFLARDNSPGSVRSYAYGLLRWWRWLQAVEVEWDQATSAETRDLVLWLGQASKIRQSERTDSAATAGTVNPITRKQYLDDHYKPRTVRHSNAVVRSFYEFWIDIGEGPLVNPVPRGRGRGRRPNQHHNPLEPFRPEGRIRYNPKVPKRRPREMPEDRWKDLFAALRSNRDRAILSTAVSSGARASELLGVRSADLGWGDQLIRVIRKGTQAEQWLPASPEAFVWLRLYLADLGRPLRPGEPVWQTLRRRDRGNGLARQPMNYEALRAVFRRINALLGTNWSMHDLRHTAAIRMSRDEQLSMRDVQAILGHAHLSTTADVYLVEDDAEVIRRVHQHLADRESQPPAPAPAAVGYDDQDLAVLFGGSLR